MTSLLRLEICDMTINYLDKKKKFKINEICLILMKKYPIPNTNYLHANVKKAVLEIFPIHINNKRHTKKYRCSKLKALEYVKRNNINLVNGYDYV